MSRRRTELDGPSPSFAGEWGSFGPYPWIWAAPSLALLHPTPSPGSPTPPSYLVLNSRTKTPHALKNRNQNEQQRLPKAPTALSHQRVQEPGPSWSLSQQLHLPRCERTLPSASTATPAQGHTAAGVNNRAQEKELKPKLRHDLYTQGWCLLIQALELSPRAHTGPCVLSVCFSQRGVVSTTITFTWAHKFL